MPIFNTFSNRNRPLVEKFVFDDIPDPLRHHSLRVLRDGIGQNNALWDEMDRILHSEHPTPSFSGWYGRRSHFERRPPPPFYEMCILHGGFYEAMDAIECGAHLINTGMRKRFENRDFTFYAKQVPDEVLAELNGRFMQHGVGFQFSKEQGRFVRVDSAFMHAEVTAPATALLMEKGFEGAAQEFQKAHEHYRHMVQDPEAGKDAVAWAAKAVESTVKTIMKARGWPYDEKKDTIVMLLDKALANGLVPLDLKSYFDGLRTALFSGLPTLRNRMAAHGQGAAPKVMEEHMVTLGMHLAAATIRFLVESHKTTKP